MHAMRLPHGLVRRATVVAVVAWMLMIVVSVAVSYKFFSSLHAASGRREVGGASDTTADEA